jgi:membrane protease subunit (stomatin/prohibitin family)
MTGKKIVKKKERPEAACRCPYCETEVMVMIFPFCQACGKTLRRCTNCLTVISEEIKICPQCGQVIE